MQWFAAQRYYVRKTYFRENRRDTKVVCPVMWTYEFCAFDTGTYYWQYSDGDPPPLTGLRVTEYFAQSLNITRGDSK